MLTDKQFLRYQRQISVPEIGESGQKVLCNSHVLIVGCGGLGSAAALYLVAAGIGKLVIADGDSVDSSNLQRQIVYRQEDVEIQKVTAMARQLNALNSDCQIRTVDRYLEQDQLNLEIMMADIVLDCSDNLTTRQAVNKACYQQNKPLVSGAAIGWQGQLALFDFAATDKEQAPCYRCLYPFDQLANSGKCSQAGIIGPVVGTIGNLQALQTIKYLTNHQKDNTNKLFLFDGLNLSWQSFAISKNHLCSVCSETGSK